MSEPPFVVGYVVGSGKQATWYHIGCLPEELRASAGRGGATVGLRCRACSKPMLDDPQAKVAAQPETPQVSERKRSSRTPDLRFKMRERDGDRKSEIGVGWLNDDGSISVSLNPGVKIEYRDCQDFYLTLFPIEKDATQ